MFDSLLNLDWLSDTQLKVQQPIFFFFFFFGILVQFLRNRNIELNTVLINKARMLKMIHKTKF
jgi:hypothetical protein